MHELLYRIFDGRLVIVPLNRLRRVLDCGFGCAAWACAVADLYPSAEVRIILMDMNLLELITDRKGKGTRDWYHLCNATNSATWQSIPPSRWSEQFVSEHYKVIDHTNALKGLCSHPTTSILSIARCCPRVYMPGAGLHISGSYTE